MSLSPSLSFDDSTLSPMLNDQLALQLAAALATDTRNEQVNSAKLRSVGQLHDYDQFKGMVAGAHLQGMDLTHQPLDTIAAGRSKAVVREEGVSGGQMRTLEYGVGRLSVKEQQGNLARQQELLAETIRNASAHKQPATAHEFKRDWRRLGSVDKPTESRHEYLLFLDADRLPVLMRGGAGLEVLGEIIDTLDAQRGACEYGAAKRVFGLIASLSCVDRFPMTVAFLTAAQKQHIASLLGWLQRQAPAAASSAQPTVATEAAEEAKEQLSHANDVHPAATEQRVNSGLSGGVSSSAPATTSISSHPRTRLPLQLPSSSTVSSYPMLIPGWSSFSSPMPPSSTPSSVSTAPSSSATVQLPAHKVGSSAVVRVPKLSFGVAGVKELRKRFNLSDE